MNWSSPAVRRVRPSTSGPTRAMDGVVSTGDGYDVIVWTKGADARLVESWWQKYDSRKSRCLKQRKSMRTLQDLRCFVAEITILEC